MSSTSFSYVLLRLRASHCPFSTAPDPTYAVKMLSEVYGQLLSFLYTELRSGILYAFSNRLDYLTILNELFLEIYQCFEAQEQPEYRNLRECVYWYASDYCDVFLADHLRESINPVYTKSVIDRIREMDLSDNRYLYSYGEYVGEKELETAEYFRNLSEEALWKIADTYTRRYRKEDCQAEKSVVQIFYRPGFERLVLAVLADLEKQGIEPVICIPASGVIARVVASDKLVIPIQLEPFAFLGTSEIASFFSDVKKSITS